MTAAKKKPIKTNTSRGHITNLKQSILETFNIYDIDTQMHNNLYDAMSDFSSQSGVPTHALNKCIRFIFVTFKQERF